MSDKVRAFFVVFVGAMILGCAGPRAASTPTPTVSAAPAVATEAPSPVPSTAASAGATGAVSVVSLEARDLSFTPKQLEAPGGQPFELRMDNAGAIVHNVTIDSPGVQLVVSPGQTGSTLVEGLAPGTYPFYCSISGHRSAGMSGDLIVR